MTARSVEMPGKVMDVGGTDVGPGSRSKKLVDVEDDAWIEDAKDQV
jgi:hypothetical protein